MRLFDIELFKAGETAVTADGHLAKFVAFNDKELYFPLVVEIDGAVYNFTRKGTYQRTGNHSFDLIGLYDEEIKYTGLTRHLWDDYMLTFLNIGGGTISIEKASQLTNEVLEERKKWV